MSKPVKVELSGVFRTAAGGLASIELGADTIDELVKALILKYPAMQSFVDDGIAVAVNGEIYRDNWAVQIADGAEVFLMPRLEGG